MLLALALPSTASPARADVVTLPGPGGVTLRAVLERPAVPSRPTIIALHGCSGLGGAARPPRLSAREREWAAPLLLQLGEADDWTPAFRCVALAARAPGRVALDVHPGAQHGFDAPDAVAPRRRTLPNGLEVTTDFDPAARAAARRAVEEFLARHAPPPG